MYVDAIYSAKESKVKVVERNAGQRVFKEYPGIYDYYVKDVKGRYKSIYGEPLSKISCSSHGEYKKSLNINSHKITYESDINPIYRILEKYYLHQTLPDLHVAFFDIETAFDKVRGLSDPDDAENSIISVAVHLQWLNQTVCLALPPPTMSMDDAKEIAEQFDNVILYHEESHLLDAFLLLIEDADILSGWHSEGFDIPYLINRIVKVRGKQETRRLCLWNEMPKPRKFMRGSKEQNTYDLIGRVHLDYLQLYKQFSYEERHSYALDAIAEAELNEKKVPYDGTLDQLYKNDFKKFLAYNIQDTELVNKLDKKLQYVELASGIAHGNCILIPASQGAVANAEQAIINEAHGRGLLIPDRKGGDEGDLPAAGGWVQYPKKGLHRWVGSSDLNSLYPSVIRALNMSPETIVGQIRLEYTDPEIRSWLDQGKDFTSWWNDKFHTREMEYFFTNDNYMKLHLDDEFGGSVELTGAELRQVIFNEDNHYCISANGTIFRTDADGIIPGLLSRWYSERKKLQAIKRDYDALLEGISLNIRKDIIEDVRQQLEKKRSEGKPKLANFKDQGQVFSVTHLKKKAESKNSDDLYLYMLSHNLSFEKDDKVHYIDKDELKKIISFWDKRQLVKKINLNSLYGGLLNEYCRFYDRRLGQSTTLTGRSIARHMAAKTNEFIDNTYDYKGRSVIYGDTDSVYFSAFPVLKEEIEASEVVWNKESVIELYDVIAKQVSDSFPTFMLETFNVPVSRGKVIASGREIVAESGLFVKKKRYALLVYDEEGSRRDIDGSPGKLKVVGLDIRRSDTPVLVQEFLSDILLKTLQLHSEDEVILAIREFKKHFSSLPAWEKGSPTGIKKLEKYFKKIQQNMNLMLSGRRKEKVTVPGHVMASINWNMLCDSYNDIHRTKILDGSKVVVCKLKPHNDMGKTSIAYPVDEPHLPEWFINLPFDEDAMMEANVDRKVKNLIGVLGWDLSRTSEESELMESLFDFD